MRKLVTGVRGRGPQKGGVIPWFSFSHLSRLNYYKVSCLCAKSCEGVKIERTVQVGSRQEDIFDTYNLIIKQLTSCVNILRLVKEHVCTGPISSSPLVERWRSVVNLNVVVLYHIHLGVVALDPFSVAFNQGVVMPHRNATANMHYNPLDLVNLGAFKRVHSQLRWIGNAVGKFLILVSVFIELESLQVGQQDLRTLLDLDFLRADLLGQTGVTVQLVRFVQQFFARETLDTIVQRGVLLQVKTQVVEVL